jgi:hypothetical protein
VSFPHPRAQQAFGCLRAHHRVPPGSGITPPSKGAAAPPARFRHGRAPFPPPGEANGGTLTAAGACRSPTLELFVTECSRPPSRRLSPRLYYYGLTPVAPAAVATPAARPAQAPASEPSAAKPGGTFTLGRAPKAQEVSFGKHRECARLRNSHVAECDSVGWLAPFLLHGYHAAASPVIASPA